MIYLSTYKSFRSDHLQSITHGIYKNSKIRDCLVLEVACSKVVLPWDKLIDVLVLVNWRVNFTLGWLCLLSSIPFKCVMFFFIGAEEGLDEGTRRGLPLMQRRSWASTSITSGDSTQFPRFTCRSALFMMTMATTTAALPFLYLNTEHLSLSLSPLHFLSLDLCI